MANEFKFRALTSEDWKGIKDENENLAEEGGLRLKRDKKDGSYISKPLDSGLESCRWHRIVLDAEIPENSTTTVSFCTSDKEVVTENWSGTIVLKKVKDALVEAPPGRYIRLKIDFHREESEESPVLRQVKIYYPRLSYLRYLPALYQEESASIEFLERFLSIFESALYDGEETISRIPLYFDPMATSDDFVPWLASWLSLDLYELLGDKNRDFILRAIEFYKQKGTVSGIASIVSFLTGKKCCVKEYMNNVFRTYGMEHYREDEQEEIVDERGCMKFYRKMSRTVNTEDRELLANMGTYSDEVHYVTDTSETGRYSPHVIGLVIFLPLQEREFIIKEDQLHKIIDSFLPVFVRAEIILVDEIDEIYDISGIHEEYADSIHSVLGEVIEEVIGVYKDTVNWNWLYTYNGISEGRTNDLQYRTPHSGIGVGIPL